MKIQTKRQRYYTEEALTRYARRLGFGEIHTKIDKETGLHAIIALHSNKLGPAIGGCRLYTYQAAGAATKDALRLAYMMTMKAAVSDLPHGGAKSVLIKPNVIRDRKAYFHSFADFVHEMNGRYITSVDVGSSVEDMNAVAERTPYVIGNSSAAFENSDPSIHTARGVMRGIEASIKFKLNRENCDGLHVAIQGAGHVAYTLTHLLIENGATVTICDPKQAAVDRLIDECGSEKIKQVGINEIYDIPCDVFSPCAMGASINFDTIDRLKTSIVAGSANNQLIHPKYARILLEKDILYAPDFVINAGGLIYAAMMYDYQDSTLSDQKIDKLYDTLLTIFDRAASTKFSTRRIAEEMAQERLAGNQPVQEEEQIL